MLALAAVLLLAGGAAAAQTASPGTARTYYDTIDLSAPDAAAQSFLAAWARRDYATVHMTFSPEAQRGWYGQIARNFSVATLFPAQAKAVWDGSIYGEAGRARAEEFASDLNLIFDDLMLAAEQAGALPFTLGPGAKVANQSASGDAAKLTVETGGRPATIGLKLVRLPSGRWKIDQIVLPDADPALKPWGFKAPQ